MKSFPIPVVALAQPGLHQEDEALNYLSMPSDMDTYRPPALPNPLELMNKPGAMQALNRVAELLQGHDTNAGADRVSILGLRPEEIELINQILGEGEASALSRSEDGEIQVRVQESIFAGVWRVLTLRNGQLADDWIEVGAVPTFFHEVARQDAQASRPVWQGELPPGVQSAPLLVDEIQDHSRCWRKGQPPHVVNLSLLPVSPEDIAFLDHRLGTGRLLMLSRGYGNCRITNTRLPNCWRVVYYNSSDTVILNTVEVVDMPEVAMAAREDLHDSWLRLRDVLDYLQGKTA
ncbi:MAG: hydrogenase-1 operon protein HyaF [Rhodospirillaceae bacterium]|jgi:hydrogenase-1 operon protein HyaF|nr:MAG: hydrogenase-1 operon protein HyaF [Rhodospirillaceae bacterium]HBH39171.1 hydrogenase expression/formation protein [Curvibacter sp.]